MKPNYYKTFRDSILKEEEVTKISNESDMEKILKNSKKITYVLSVLLTTQNKYNDEAKDQIRQVVSDIRCISYKPTTFRVVITNGNYFDLKYDPTPLELRYPEDFKPSDAFTVVVSGKKYNIANRSELEQCLDYINVLLKTKPVVKSTEEIPSGGEGAPEEAPTPEEPQA